MAENEAENEAPDTGSKKNIIVLAVAVLIAVAASVGGTMFFLGAGSEEPAEVGEAVNSTKPATAVYHSMRPPYIVNYVTGSKPRYLQAEFTVMARSEAAIDAVILHMPLIRSEIISYLTEQKFLELQTQEGKEKIRRGIVELVNEILSKYEVSPGIESALITNFVLQ